ncbi:MAG: signal peptidase I [Candidatus Coprovivens sp.]
MKKIFNNKIFDFIITGIEVIISLFLIGLIIVTGVQRFSDQGSFFGYRIYTVASESMIPIYTIGDTLLIKDTDSKDIKIGDALTYIGEANELKGKIVTHQVVDIETDSETGKYLFHTKGIANNIEDPIVNEEQVFGKVIYKFLTLSWIGKITLNMTTLLIFITIPVAILIAIELCKIVKDKYYEDDDTIQIVENTSEEIEEDNK